MASKWWCAAALAVALPCVRAQGVESDKLREEVRRLQERVQAVEKARAAGESAFNPAISLILQGTAAHSSQDPDAYQITGFAPSGGEVGPAPRSLSLGESELIVSANIDPYFRGQLVAALTPENEVEVEEAFFQTLMLGRGFTLKGGRFLSGIGYQNEIHQHAWDFQDAPLAYKAFLGGRFNDDGLQLRWLAPTDLFLEFGAEAGRGRAFPSAERSANGAGAWSVFAHAGGDIGASTAWRAGLSYLYAEPENRAFADVDSLGNPVTQSFSGRSKLWIADFVLKWAPAGNAAVTNLKLQGEYFRRDESGTLDYDDRAQSTPQFGTPFSGTFASRQSGWYLQAVYQFMPRWRVGLRFDQLDYGSVSNGIVAGGAGPAAADFPLLGTPHDPSRASAMVDWSASEFSRIRLQVAEDDSRAGVTDRQVLVQYVFSLGAHGAHKF
ncbi:MAG TPA: TonB-dependent receptor [Burkholderiales bacterium]